MWLPCFEISRLVALGVLSRLQHHDSLKVPAGAARPFPQVTKLLENINNVSLSLGDDSDQCACGTGREAWYMVW